jgi:hypothetical protein
MSGVNRENGIRSIPLSSAAPRGKVKERWWGVSPVGRNSRFLKEESIITREAGQLGRDSLSPSRRLYEPERPRVPLIPFLANSGNREVAVISRF